MPVLVVLLGSLVAWLLWKQDGTELVLMVAAVLGRVLLVLP